MFCDVLCEGVEEVHRENSQWEMEENSKEISEMEHGSVRAQDGAEEAPISSVSVSVRSLSAKLGEVTVSTQMREKPYV